MSPFERMNAASTTPWGVAPSGTSSGCESLAEGAISGEVKFWLGLISVSVQLANSNNVAHMPRPRETEIRALRLVARSTVPVVAVVAAISGIAVPAVPVISAIAGIAVPAVARSVLIAIAIGGAGDGI